MKAEVSIIANRERLEDSIPDGLERYDAEFGRKEDEPESVYLSNENVKVDINEISDQSIGMTFETSFGSVSVWLTPSREFLASIMELAVERANKALKILEAGE